MLLLYMLFFDYDRGSKNIIYEIHPYPFQTISKVIASGKFIEIYRNIGGNIGLFMAYGFLGILYPKLNKYIYLFLSFFLAINFIEFSQYFFNRGFAEADDVILNMIGMTLGFFIYKKSTKNN